MNSRASRLLQNIVNGGLDPESADLFLLRHVRILNLCCISILVAGVLWQVNYLLAGRWLSAATIAAGGVGGLVAMWYLRRTQNPTGAGYMTVVLLFVVVVGTNYVNLSGVGANLTWMLVVPAFAGLAVGLRALILFTLASALAIVAFYVLPDDATRVGAGLATNAAVWHDLSGRLTALVSIALLSAWFVFERRRSDKTLRDLVDNLETANATKNAFLARMSHEIRTPINAMIGMTRLLRDTRLDTTQRDYIETIRSSGESLIALVGNILDFARMESGKARLEPLSFDPRSQLEDITDLFANMAHDRGIELLWRADAAVPARVQADETRLRQVLVNLVNNALKFTDTGFVRIDLQAQTDTDSVTLIYAISDSGLGIAADKLAYVFEPFAQADETATRSYGGAGLGLAICRDLIELLGGTITVVSQLGKGATFRFRVPAALQAPKDPTQQAVLSGLKLAMVCPTDYIADHAAAQFRWLGADVETFGSLRVAQAWAGRPDIETAQVTAIVSLDGLLRQEARAAAQLAKQAAQSERLLLACLSNGGNNDVVDGWKTLALPLQRRRIVNWFAAATGAWIEGDGETHFSPLEDLVGTVLVAEDNVVNQKVIRLLLERFGLKVDVVGNGQEAIDAAQRHKYDVVLLDCEMPVLSGYDAAAALRRHSNAAELPILAVTAHADAAARQRCLEVGMNDVLTKPIRDEMLYAHLAQWLRRGQSPFRGYVRLDENVFRLVAARTHGDGDPDAIEAVFVRTGQASLASLRAALAREDAAGVRFAAHSLKGSAAAIGAERLSKIAEAVERTARGRELGEAQSLLTVLEAEFEALRRQF